MSWAREQRMKFITSRLAAQGFINRSHIIGKFGASPRQASRDLMEYLRANPGSMVYSSTKKRYEECPFEAGGPPMKHQVVFFCPGCRRRIACFRDTPFCWHLNATCPTAGSVRMRRSKNQDIGEAERSHANH